MKILFGSKYFGKDIRECPSSFLCWCIEEYKEAEWLLINACKTELAARLKLEWTSPPKPLTNADILIMFRRHVYDRLHSIGWTEERVLEAGGKEVGWIKPEENKFVSESFMRALDRIAELEGERTMLRKICQLFGLSRFDVEKYYFNPALLDDDIFHAQLDGIAHTPIALHKYFSKHPTS